jgi:hypothetical protein
MKVVTVINDEKNFIFRLLRLSCAVNNLNLVTLVSNKSVFFSNRLKDDLLNAYLQDEKDEEIILFTDGNDAIFNASEEEILSKFSEFKSDLVFSAEVECWPDKELAHQYINNNTTPYKYLNSGGFIGKAGLIKELLNDIDYDLENYPKSNQYLWTKRFLKNSGRIKLDTFCSIFCTFAPEIGGKYITLKNQEEYAEYLTFKKKWFSENFLIENGRIYNKITNTWPCHAHFNGLSKLLINDEIIDIIYSKVPNYEDTEFYIEE